MKCRLRQSLQAVTGVLALAVWLFMMAAEAYAPLHAWLHGGSIPDDDDCAIVALAHGKVEAAAGDIPVAAPITWVEVVTPCVEFSVFSRTIENRLSGRAPPVLFAVS